MSYFSSENWRNANGRPRIFKIIGHAIFWIIILALIKPAFPFGTVPAGHRGVQLRFNAVTGKAFNEGLFFRIPFIEQVVRVNVQTQKHEVKALAYSKDIQTVDSTLALNYHLNPETVADLYQEVGLGYRERIIDPAIQESVKAATAKFTAQELIEQRPLVKDEIQTHLRERLSGRDIVVEEFSIVNFDFSDVYEQAVEKKQVAQQEALTEKNRLERVKYEAEQRVAQAKGEAEAIRIQTEAIKAQGGEAYVELKRVEKWDGKYPQTYFGGNATPLVTLPSR